MDQQHTSLSCLAALTPAEARTAAAIRTLIDGASPAALPPPPPGGYGPWDAVLHDLAAAHTAGGTAAVIARYQEQFMADDAFVHLMSAGAAVEAPCPPFATKRTAGAGWQAGLEAGLEAGPGLWPGVGAVDGAVDGAELGWDLDLLAEEESETVEYIVNGLLPVGVTNVAGRPKIGKSWWILQLFVAASYGLPFLGFAAPKLKCYYLALEDSKGRLIDRLKKVRRGLGVAAPSASGSHIFNECPTVAEDGLQQVRSILQAGYRLVIIDTFSRFLGRSDQMDQQEMTRVVAALQHLAFTHHAAIVVVDHHRKSARTSLDADPVDDIMGATAKGGVVDCAIGLYRRHNQNEATLKLTGRDFDSGDLALEWDPDAFLWLRKETKARHLGQRFLGWPLSQGRPVGLRLSRTRLQGWRRRGSA